MKSDWDDVSDYIGNNKKQSSWRTFFILGVGSVIIRELITLFTKPAVTGVNHLKPAIHTQSKREIELTKKVAER